MLHQGFQSIVFHGDSCLGEAEIFPLKNSNFQFHSPNNEIRITHFSLPSERCLPLSVLQTISPFSLRFKLQSKSPAEDSLLNRLHASCFRELKTAIVVFGDEELHLIAMPSKLEKKSCFWGFSASSGLYNSCLGMLNLRCLGIVFDLDETLIVANTMRSFEDRIDAIQRKIGSEVDPVRISGMTTELKRYLEDKMLLKQYSESDTVTDNGRLIKVQSEEVPPLSDGQERVVRPIIRLQDKNIVLTRINPEVRDTSVLVRLRPAWEDLRSYLTARGRKRFEVYVCTMAERDYALEMWRLLDPEAHLISSKQLLARVVCVKSGSRKSLLNVFQDGIFHPKMAMVIDDRLKVWDDKDQSRVHVVPAFAPYYAPQAEIANAVPVLCVARNVACNVRGGFFKEFDDNLLRRVSEVYYEDDVIDLPSAPDVSNYLMSEDSGGASNGNRDLPVIEGMSDAEVERRVKHTDEKFSVEATSLPAIINNPPTVTNNLDMRPELPLQHVAFPTNILLRPTSGTSIPVQRSSLLGTPGIEADVSQAELDPDTRRRLLILQHGQDTRDHSSNDLSYQSRPPALIPVMPAIQPLRGCFSKDEDMILGQYNRRTPGLRQESDPLQPNKHRSQQTPFFRGVESSIPSEKYRNFPQVKEEVYIGDDWLRQNHVHSNRSSFSEDDETATDQASTNNTLSHTEAGILAGQPSMYVGVLQEIGMKCGYKVEYKSVVNTSKDLPFSAEALFTGEKIGAGMGKTKKEAQQVAAGNALLNLANKYWACISPEPGAVDGDLDKLSLGENGFLMDIVDLDSEELQRKEVSPRASTSELLGLSDDSKRLSRTVSALKELCMTENLSLVFQDQLPISNKGEFHAQVEVAGQIIGKGIGSSRERAKLQAAEEALGSFKLVFNQQAPKRSNSPRSPPTIPTKRSKEELLRGLPGLPSSSRYNKNGHPVS